MDACTLYIFDHEFAFRRWMVKLTLWEWFDPIIIAVILLNSLLLCLTDFSLRGDEFSEWNHLLERIDLIFSVIFILECSAKIIARGFVFHENSYMRSPWNWLDFLVVLTTVANFKAIMPGNVDASGVKVLRTLRCLRPLRTLQRMPKLKVLI